jgi:Trk K+ transport system NAD-binding subunit
VPTELFDVAIVSIKTGLIESVVGRALREDRAERRIDTALYRIDRENYFVSSYPSTTPTLKAGDKVPKP